jgi:hypothetical protein
LRDIIVRLSWPGHTQQIASSILYRFFFLLQNVPAFQAHDHSFHLFLCLFKKLYQIIMLELIPASLTAVHYIPPYCLAVQKSKNSNAAEDSRKSA